MTPGPERRYALDTNIFVDAWRDRRFAESLGRFHSAFAPFEHLCAVVVHEMLAGTRSDADLRELERQVLEPFRERARIFTPRRAAWESAGLALARLAKLEHATISAFDRSFRNDMLIAASCREEGITLVTRNTRDFTRIAGVLPFSFTPPWPTPNP